MRILKKLLKLLLIILLVVIVFGFWYYNHLKPSYSGEVSLTTIETETTVYFDDFGIPHIYADSHMDAIATLGYVQAQDRLWQMELMRRIAPGRLAELFGKNLVENDKFFVSLGIDEYSEKSVANLDTNSEVYQLMNAYLKGINQFIDEGPTPIEHKLIGLKKEHFVIKDVYNVLGYMAFSFAMAQKT
ncbi:MAG: penicillin amidase, partial [Flavobacteriaceae bacterium]